MNTPNNPEGLPPGHIPRPTYNTALPNVTDVICDFFNQQGNSRQPFNNTLITEAARLETDELQVLLNRGKEVVGRTTNAINERAPNASYPEIDTFYGLSTGPMHLHEESMEIGRSISLTALTGLAQTALYCDRIIVRDTLFTPRFTQAKPAQEFAQRLHAAKDLAGLIRLGVLVPVHEDYLSDKTHVLLNTFLRSDPLARQLLQQHPHTLEAIRNTHAKLGESLWDQRIPNVRVRFEEAAAHLNNIYPDDISSNGLSRILRYCQQVRSGSFLPITSSKQVAQHLMACTDRPDGMSTMQQGLQPAILYQVPIFDVATITRLRQNEELFAEMADAARQLDAACAQSAKSFESYEAYVRVISRHADNIIGPIYRRLQTWQKKAIGQKNASDTAITMADWGFNVTLPPGISHIAKMATSKLFGVDHSQRITDATLAAGILQTLIPLRANE